METEKIRVIILEMLQEVHEIKQVIADMKADISGVTLN